MRTLASGAFALLLWCSSAKGQTLVNCEDYNALDQANRTWYVSGLVDGVEGALRGVLELVDEMETQAVPDESTVEIVEHWTDRMAEDIRSYFTGAGEAGGTVRKLVIRLHARCQREEDSDVGVAFLLMPALEEMQ